MVGQGPKLRWAQYFFFTVAPNIYGSSIWNFLRVALLILRILRCFSDCPDRPWGPPSLLYNGYRVFAGGKVPGAWC